MLVISSMSLIPTRLSFPVDKNSVTGWGVYQVVGRQRVWSESEHVNERPYESRWEGEREESDREARAPAGPPSQAAGPLKGGRRPRAGSWGAQDGDDLRVGECLAPHMALGGKCELRKCQGRAGFSAGDPVGPTSAAAPACPNGACLGGGRFSLPAGAMQSPRREPLENRAVRPPQTYASPRRAWGHCGRTSGTALWAGGGCRAVAKGTPFTAPSEG